MMTTITADELAADRELKAKHRAVWASGNYPELASDLIWSLGPVLVDACRIGPGHRVLDVAAGSGNAAIPAALAGAAVVASDLTPELFEAGRRRATDAGATLDWQEADVENLPYADGTFDAVLSCVGVMFAPHHERSADELARVCRPGGTIGLISWTPSGFIGQLFATMKPYSPPPPAGAQPPPLWGDEAHVRGLFGDRVTNVTAERRTVEVSKFSGATDFRDYFTSHYGPTIATYRYNAADPSRVAELDAAIDALAARYSDQGTMRWEYLLVTATRAG
jgi:SAM-dependent methyltransferase